MAFAKTARSSNLRNTFTVAAILGAGVFVGALFAETSVMNFNLPSARALLPRRSGVAMEASGYPMPAYSPSQSRRPVPHRSALIAHHSGI